MPRAKPGPSRRRFIRHPSRMPIACVVQGDAVPRRDRLLNVGQGGLCFVSAVPLEAGLAIRLTIPLLGRQFELDGVVAWCRALAPAYEVGVRFPAVQDRFCARMVEQLCYIEDYRQQVAREEGRQLSSEQAAQEWIERFAGQFPALH